MIRIRSVALGLAILTGSAVAAGAQSTTTPPAGQRQHGAWGKGGEHGMMGRRLFNGIDLTADQQARIKQINEKYRDEMRSQFGAAKPQGGQGDVQGARRERPQLTPEQRQQMRALHDRQVAEIRGVLTPAQQQRFDANLADAKAKREAHMKDRGARHQRQG